VPYFAIETTILPILRRLCRSTSRPRPPRRSFAGELLMRLRVSFAGH
jgi:hypothetical protein